MDDMDKEFKQDFLNEAKELLDSTEQSFLELEQKPDDSSLINNIFRFAHNLKGTSRAVGFGQIAELTHKAENLLLKLKNAEMKADERTVNALLAFNDQVKIMVEGLRSDLNATFEIDKLNSELDLIASNQTEETSSINEKYESFEEIKAEPEEVAEEVPSSEAEKFEEEETSESVINPQAMADLEAYLKEHGGTVEEKENKPVHISLNTKHEDKKSVEPQIIKSNQTVPDTSNKAKDKTASDDETIRVSLARLDKMNDLVGELVILQSVAEQALVQSSNNKIARSLTKLCKDIQDLSMSLRMVQVGPTFQKLNRTVRDTSKLLGKKVNFKIIGEHTEIDKIVLEKLGDPLVHIIRNSVDHGVEAPEIRLQNGKDEVGTVEVMAFHEGNYLVIQITDDGKGIDPAKITQKAIEKGVISASQKLTDQQAVELIFHPGFSTKEQVSEVSGRGVGMDVVKTNIEALGGSVKILSKAGVGSSIRLVLPLTLAIIEGMQIICGNQRLIVPRIQVHEVTKLDPARLTELTGRNPYYRLREEVIPVYLLHKDFSISSEQKPNIALIVRSEKNTFAVCINDVERQQQVVVKTPTAEALKTRGVMGTTILSDGAPALIIDLIDLYKNSKPKELIQTKATQVAA
jgi:two-component system chemotaxis sensor kinase CheA